MFGIVNLFTRGANVTVSQIVRRRYELHVVNGNQERD